MLHSSVKTKNKGLSGCGKSLELNPFINVLTTFIHHLLTFKTGDLMDYLLKKKRQVRNLWIYMNR